MELKLAVENVLYVAIFVIGFLPIIGVVLFRVRKSIRFVLITGAALVLLAVVQRPIQDTVFTSALPTPTMHGGMQPSGACMSCHPGQYAAWYASYHRTMTQKVGPETVVAPFDGRRLEWQGRAFVVDRREQEFWVTEVKPEESQGEVELEAPKRVVMSTGSRHQQIYKSGLAWVHARAASIGATATARI